MSELRMVITPEEITAVLMAVRLGADMAETCVAVGVNPQVFRQEYDRDENYKYWETVGLFAGDAVMCWNTLYKQRIVIREAIMNSLHRWTQTQKEAACSTE